MNRQKGFSIIELMVIILVISILLSVVVANFPKVRLQFSLLRANHAFAQTVRQAQQMALSGFIYKDSSGVEQEVDGYGVYVSLSDLGDKEYILYADKAPGDKKYTSADYTVETIDFSAVEPGIKIKQIDNVSSDQASINFNISIVETTITELSPGQTRADVVFAFESDDAVTKKVRINTAGLIETQ